MKKIHLNRALAAKKKKLTILFALLCASVMSWAADYCNAAITSLGGRNATVTMRLVRGTTYEFSITTVDDITSYSSVSLWLYRNGSETYNFGNDISRDGNTLSVQFTSSSVPRIYNNALFISLNGYGENRFDIPTDASWAACAGGDPNPDPDPEPEPEPNPNSYTAGGHTITLDASYVGDIYTLVITSADDMTGLGGSFWYVNGVSTDMRSNSGTNSYIVSGDKKTITCQVQSSSAPSIHTPLFVLMPGEINFGNVTLNWEDRTPITSEYCNYQGPETQQDGHYYAITWETDPSGNVVITIGNGTGAGECSFRNGGFEGGNNGLDNFVVSDDNFATTTPATDYFTVTRPQDGDLQYVMTKIADLPANAKIKHLSAGAIAWREASTDRWCFPNFIYTYGGTCNQLDAPTNVAIDGTNHITFDAVSGAETYTAYVSLGGVEKYSQEVASGDELAFIPYITGDYTVNVVASASGKTDSDPSADVVWHLEAEPIVLGNSEYCEWALPKHNDKDANLTVETNDEGSIICTLSPLSGQTAVFRGQGMKLSAFSVGAMHTPASVYFNRVYTEGGSIVTLTLKDPDIKPGLGEKIYFSDVIECKVEGTNTWPNTSLEYTYGTVCPGLKSVSATPNNAEYGSASVVVKSTGSAPEEGTVDAGTEVTFSATPNDGYVFVNWSNGETRATFDAVVNTNMNLTANFRALNHISCNEEMTNGDYTAYVTYRKTANENEYEFIVRSAQTMTGFSNTNIGHLNGSNYFNLNGQGSLTGNGHKLSYTFTSTTEPKLNTPLYVNFANHGEVTFNQINNSTVFEFSQPCADPEITAIELNKTEATLDMGNTLTLVPTFTPAYMSADITWQTSDAGVATVNNGVVTPVTTGNVTITAKVTEDIKATCSVTVQDAASHNWYGYGTDKDLDYTYRIEYTTDQRIVAHVKRQGNKTGLVDVGMNINNNWTAINVTEGEEEGWKKGTTEATFTTGDNIHIIFQSNWAGPSSIIEFNYEVGSDNDMPTILPSTLALSNTSITMGLSDADIQLTAEIHHRDAANKTITWTSDNESIVTVVDGLVHPVGVGRTTVHAATFNGISATCEVTVEEALEPTIFWGSGEDAGISILYSITRNADHTLTYAVEALHNKGGFELQVNDGDWHNATLDEGVYTWSSTATYTDGDAFNGFFYMPFSVGAGRVDFHYVVGSKFEKGNMPIRLYEDQDNSFMITASDGLIRDVKVTRSFTAGNLYTLVLPFDVDAAQTASQLPGQLTKLNNSYLKDNGDLRINFVNVSAVEAGVPYLYQPSADVTNPTFEGVEVSATLHPTKPADGYAQYHGIYAPMEDGNALHAITNAYVLGPDQYLYAVSDLPNNQTMKALRAYFVLNFSETTPGSPKRLAKVVFNENETETTTDIEDLQTDIECTKVIVNGQLQIIRDGKTYNAFGQLVK